MNYQKEIEDLNKVIKRLKELRELKGVSLQEVFDETGVHIARVESTNQNITITTLSKLCQYYGISLKEFFSSI